MKRSLAIAAAVSAAALAWAAPARAIDDGLARTPPMGFNNWNATGCGSDFNEALVKSTADFFVSSGLKDAGYRYVNLDDCWALPQRDADGKLVPDPARFPNGIAAVADYVHSKGLKLGIYTSAGTKTCNSKGFPGGLGHEASDAQQFADWGVDYLKYDNCNNQGVDAVQRYTAMRDALKATGRPIVFSICEWGQNKPWTWAKDVGHLWRTTGDIGDSYASMLGIVHQNMVLADYAGPGHWNDPDMLEVGNGGMTDTEYRSHFSLWAIMAAPLLIGSDLRKATPETMKILLNRDAIAVDQDPLGAQGRPIATGGGHDVLVKPLADGGRAVALFNETDAPARIATSATAAGLPGAPAYTVRDLWTHETRETAGTLAATVPAHGTVLLRVARDPRWFAAPPAVEAGLDVPAAYPGATPFVTPGKATTVTTTATNDGRLPALLTRARLTAPGGWTVHPAGRTWAPLLLTGRSLTTHWSVMPPAGLAAGTYPLELAVRYAGGVSRTTVDVVVATPAPSGTSFLSDVPWLSAANGYGPAELDTSNGESQAHDGHTLTIGGVTYAKGIGAHAPSAIAYYLGGRCSSVTADVGVDDEKSAKGTVDFQLWADDRVVADSGLRDTTMGPLPLAGDVTGATVLRLVVTDGGDGNDSDHADWADAKLTCT